MSEKILKWATLHEKLDQKLEGMFHAHAGPCPGHCGHHLTLTVEAFLALNLPKAPEESDPYSVYSYTGQAGYRMDEVERVLVQL